MTDEIEKEEEYTLTAEYVLGLLTAEETGAYEEVLGVDPALRDEYAFWADRMVALTDDIAPVTPPPHVLARIKSTLFHDAATTKGSATGRNWLQRLGLLPAMAGGLLAALAVLWLFNVAVPPAVGPVTPTYTAQIAAEDNSLVVLASFDAAAQTLTLTRQTGAAPEGKSLELWLIAGENAPVSLGVLQDGADTELTVDAALVPALEGGTLAITDEPLGGSPSGAPTGSVMAAGQVIQA